MGRHFDSSPKVSWSSFWRFSLFRLELDGMSLGLKNWAGNFEYQARKLHETSSISEVQDVVRKSSQVRVLGSRHCFNGIADAEELISLHRMSKVEVHHGAEPSVSVYGSITYGELCPILQQHGLALPNLASLPNISVTGAIASATHGAGQRNGNLATVVVALQLVNGSGQLVEFKEAQLRQAVVGLGCLGVVTKTVLRLEPSFLVCQRCFEGLRLSDVSSQEELDSVLGAAYSVSLWTTWAGKGDDMEFSVWLKERVETSTESTSLPRVLERCQECKEQQHPSKGRDPSACIEQLTPGPWHLRLPHFKMERVPNSGEELQSEYFVPRRFAAKALCAIAGISGIFRQWLRSSEIRAIAADDLLMSPHSKDFVGDDGSVGFHFTWKLAEVEVKSMALPEIERVLEPFNARPHWGKLFIMRQSRLEQLYGTALVEFRQLANQMDPAGKFCNQWVQETIGDYTRESGPKL